MTPRSAARLLLRPDRGDFRGGPIPMDGFRERDVRRRPNRGVRIRPLPKHMHAEFRRFVADLRRHAQSHRGTWQLATSESDQSWVAAELAYWKTVIKYLNAIEYYGTQGHATGRTH